MTKMRHSFLLLVLAVLIVPCIAQGQVKSKLFIAPEASILYTMPAFEHSSLHTIKADPFYSKNIGIVLYLKPVGIDKVQRKNLFSIGTGVNIMNYTIHDHIDTISNLVEPVGGTHFMRTFRYWSANSLTYEFHPLQIYLQMRYTRFMGNFFISGQAGVSVTTFKKATQTIYTTTKTYLQIPVQDSTGNWSVIDDTLSTYYSRNYNSYPGTMPAYSLQMGIHAGFKWKRFMPYLAFEFDRNKYYQYKKLGIGMTVLLEKRRVE